MDTLGPALWKTIHTYASQCRTPEEKRRCIEYLHYLQSVFPCPRCKPHFGQYLLQNKPNCDMDLFFWTVEFHNAVNRRLGKPTMDLIDACDLYGYRANMMC
jgi:hypothetical protein